MEQPTLPMLVEETTVKAEYQMFCVHDPTCDEDEEFKKAFAAASGGVVGWAAGIILVRVVTDMARIRLSFEVHHTAPPPDVAAEIVSESDLIVPGGLLKCPDATGDDRFLVGVELPPGPGTYSVRVCGYGRARARELWDRGMREGGDLLAALPDALRGVEYYRLLMWQTSREPRWPDDDDDE